MMRGWRFGLRWLWLVPATVLVAAALTGRAPASDTLKEGFRDPPREYSLESFWSWNSTLEPDKLTWQMDQMAEKGIYGTFMHARAGLDESKTPYFSEGFWNGIRTSVEHAEKIGFHTWIYDEDAWPSGDAGGRTRAANPERYTGYSLAPTSVEWRGPSSQPVRFPNNAVVVAARKTREGSIDVATLTDLSEINRAEGEWRVPSGEWIVSVFEVTHGRRALPNYLNPDAVGEFKRNTYEEYAKRFSQYFGKTIPGAFFDEIFMNVPGWEPILEDRFRNHKGYDLRTSLPLLYLDGGPRTIKVRCDYFEELTRLYEEAWFRQLSDWCEKHNLKLTGHTIEDIAEIRGQGDMFRIWRHPQIPGTDNEDFRYTWPRTIGAWKPKQLSSVAHVYGRPRVMVEALGGAGWTITLDQARYGVNMLAAYGINKYVLHLFHYALDTRESMDDWPNSWFYQNPYWKYFRKFADHTRRLSFMGSQGRHVSDIAVLYPVEEVWSRGLAGSTADFPPVDRLVERLVSEQLDADLVDTDSLVAAEPEANGRTRIGVESYRVLVLPDVRTVSLAAYRKVAQLAEKGLRIVALGAPPRHSAENGADDPEVLRISRQLFGDVPRTAANLDALAAELRRLGPPDFRSDDAGRALRYYHRRIGDRDVYFLANSEPKPFTTTVTFAASGAAERWEPETGETTPLPAQPGAALELRFAPWQAYFVVFDSSRPAGAPAVIETKERAIPLTGPWSFQLAPHELDYAWNADPGLTRVEVPVADFRVERAGSAWRRIKISDTSNPSKGVARYLTAWDAPWITRYVYRTGHPGQLGGSELVFSRTFDVGPNPTSGWFEALSDGELACAWNDLPLGTAGNLKPLRVPDLRARPGPNTIRCTVKRTGFLLVQGEIRGASGPIPIRTSSEWQVETPGGPSTSAYEFAWPPFGTWGDVPLGGRGQVFPVKVSYRFAVPPGARELEAPQVAGRWSLSGDGRNLPTSGARLNVAGMRSLVLQVDLERAEQGLQAPPVFHCGRASAQLGDWQTAGLDWYSGRAIYQTRFEVPSTGVAGASLDLGELCYTGEVWVNGKLVDTLAWPPYRVDITRFVHRGGNDLVVVAANLLANQMRWNLFDSAVSVPISRWWHDGNILRDGDKLRSGLIGPVRLLVRNR